MKRIHLSSSEYLSKQVTYLSDKAADHPFKPNGLWYAMNEEWQKWCDDNMEKLNYLRFEPSSFVGYKYRYDLSVDLRKVCVLDDVDVVFAFHRKYGYKYKGNCTVIDWEKVKGDYSGIEVRNFDVLNFECSFRAIIWLQNWAVNGGCIWDLSVMEVIGFRQVHSRSRFEL